MFGRVGLERVKWGRKMAFVHIGGVSTGRISTIGMCYARVIRGRSVAPVREISFMGKKDRRVVLRLKACLL